ncbi:MAG: glycosyltransferase family 2 protein [Erythrobacter sp.]
MDWRDGESHERFAFRPRPFDKKQFDEPMTSNDLVTAVITTKDRPEFLRRAVSSVLTQSYRPLELVIVDDGSASPVTEEMFQRSNDVELRIVRNESARGVSAARNFGVSNARGRFVAFLDDDDRWLADKVERQVNLLASRSDEVLACGCQITIVDHNGNNISDPERPTLPEDIIASLTYSDENITPSTLMFDRQTFIELGGYREDMPAAEDREFLLRFLLRYGLEVLPERMVQFTEHKGERLTRNSDAMFLGELKYLEFVKAHAGPLGVKQHRAVGYRYAKVGHQAMLAGRWLIGLENFTRGMLTYPFDKRIVGGWLLALLGPNLYYLLISLRIERIR